MSTRPRITFDERGWCSACCWMETKKNLDWDDRKGELTILLNQYRRSDGNFDCIVPVSGGKDGSYVAYMLKNVYGMNPLCITVTPPLPLELGERNLRSFVEKGYSHISVNPPYEAMRAINRSGYINMGFPYYGWLIAIHTAVIKVAQSFKVDIIFYGEDGEIEYGGSNETLGSPLYDTSYQKKIYLEGGYDKVIAASSIDPREVNFFKFPKESLSDTRLKFTHWSYFENWDPYRNYLIAKEYCGLMEMEEANQGTFTNFSQNDQALYALHTYLMYLKFGFGRANQDACIEIRRGAMDRKQAVNLVNLYDGAYPEPFIKQYLNYYQITKSEFDTVIDNYANKDLFEKINGRWNPKFKIV